VDSGDVIFFQYLQRSVLAAAQDSYQAFDQVPVMDSVFMSYSTTEHLYF